MLWCDFLIARISGIAFIFMGLYLMDLEIRFCFDYSITLVTGKSYTFMKILALEHESVLFFELIIAMITYFTLSWTTSLWPLKLAGVASLGSQWLHEFCLPALFSPFMLRSIFGIVFFIFQGSLFKNYDISEVKI